MTRATIIINDSEKELFYPEAVLNELKELLPYLERIDPTKISGDELMDQVLSHRPEIIITCWSCPTFPLHRIEEFKPFLKYICHTGGTIRKMVPREFIEQGFCVSNWGKAVSKNVAEGAFVLIFSALRNLSYWAIQMHREKGWKQQNMANTATLIGKKVGIHGLGAISFELIKFLNPFDCEISVCADWGSDEMFSSLGIRRALSLESMFSESDVIVELSALTPENHHIVDEALLRKIKPKACFINVGRGALVDEATLIKIAKEGQIQIALDVYEVEPLPADSGLRGLDNVTLMPHLAGPTMDYMKVCGDYANRNLRRYLQQEELESVINLEIYDRTT